MILLFCLDILLFWRYMYTLYKKQIPFEGIKSCKKEGGLLNLHRLLKKFKSSPSFFYMH
jgi:hypothetical protein